MYGLGFGLKQRVKIELIIKLKIIQMVDKEEVNTKKLNKTKKLNNLFIKSS